MYTARLSDAGDADVWKCVRYTAIYGSRSACADSFGTVAVQIHVGASVACRLFMQRITTFVYMLLYTQILCIY